MGAEFLVAAVKEVVHDSANESVLAELDAGPAGRTPPPRLQELSEWFQAASREDRERIRQVIGLAVHASTFGLLAVLDGVRVIDDGGATTLELFLVNEGTRTRVNASPEPLLHDTYQSMVYEDVFGATI